MTPKEKAIELIRKYKGFSCIRCYGKDSDLVTAKQCASIAVDEILSVIQFTDEKKEFYWDEVKKEIEICITD